jgi:hypothetical protein
MLDHLPGFSVEDEVHFALVRGASGGLGDLGAERPRRRVLLAQDVAC